MPYFARRNEYIVEFSGHSDVSIALRSRLLAILQKFVRSSSVGGANDWFIGDYVFRHAVQQEIPSSDPYNIIKQGTFYEVFTVIEIFLNLVPTMRMQQREIAISETVNAFELSGSVYKIIGRRQIELKIDKELAEKIDSVKKILQPFPVFYERFFNAVGNLVGRKAKPEDVVKDIYVSAEGYLKSITGENTFGDAVKYLDRKSLIISEQKKVLEALQRFRSDAEGAGHAGNSSKPTEATALWFLDTMIAQLRMIDAVKPQS